MNILISMLSSSKPYVLLANTFCNKSILSTFARVCAFVVVSLCFAGDLSIDLFEEERSVEGSRKHNECDISFVFADDYFTIAAELHNDFQKRNQHLPRAEVFTNSLYTYLLVRSNRAVFHFQYHDFEKRFCQIVLNLLRRRADPVHLSKSLAIASCPSVAPKLTPSQQLKHQRS
jgi:hypothetical protein